MFFRRKIHFARCALYLFLLACSLCFYAVGRNGEPLSLALAYAMMGAGLSLPLSALVGALPALLCGVPSLFFLYAVAHALLALGFLAQRKLRPDAQNKIGVFPLLALSVSMGIYVAFFPFNAYLLPFGEAFQPNALSQKTAIAGALFLLSNAFYVALRAIFQKLLKCRLRNDEIAFCLLLFALLGVGLCRFFGLNAYMGISFFILLLFACATQNASTLLCALCLALPPLVCFGYSIERFFLYGAAATLFIRSGRLAAVCALLAIFFGYGYFDGLYGYPTPFLVSSLLSAMLPCLFFILLPNSLLRALENKLIFYREKHLSRLAINRNRAAVGEKLFEISYVFREIENAFNSLGSREAEVGAKEYIRASVIEECCQRCPQFTACKKAGFEDSLEKLIDVGCLKGKASLIDLPRALSDLCFHQNSILQALNTQLTEYKRYMTEAENAASGRSLLAGQAQGVSEILRSLALEQSQPLAIYSDKERALHVALLRVGVVCSELLIYGEENDFTLSLITFGEADVKKIAAVASHLFGMTMMISEKLHLSQGKVCCILRKKPVFDAAFGVSSTKKTGELESGDTHSIIKIDERKFMVALSDGMGSGEYAHKVSESTISLLESFYRAKMPSPLVLSAVNKLMTFNKEESFACVDIAVVDLDSGEADIVKIGSPLGFIVSGNTVKVLESSSLPMGILDSLRPDFSTYTLQENDVLIFLSDGVADAFGSTTDLYESLRSVPVRNPQQLTDVLLEKALTMQNGIAKDDMTATAVRLFKA